ncbi:redoxin domain-containing protein [Siphonobacter aquaeclarae]|jgi:peroxiredoxin|uniref:Peroxiredoxin n=1 Tax=Siphonobacter aquaeclarae TaxID=563176 RepID=A0A1G9R7R4_9BACT|nr:redoxin domain-containing protein [Siphonobacter aquaeclarae]SDM18475.1 Peroxiredoxin [Siphonobacter aquaeclarae]
MLYEIEDELGNITSLKAKPLPARRPERTSPLVKGQQAPSFQLRATSGVWNARLAARGDEELTLGQLVQERPLVLSFYCPCWNAYAPKHLHYLQQLYQNIRGLGGELLVLSNEPGPLLQQLAEQEDLDFNLAYDRYNQIAGSFGVYSDSHPLWERVSGISDDAYIPAVYVIDRQRQIVFDFVDENLELTCDARELLTALYHAR